jgi:hypothetical protein
MAGAQVHGFAPVFDQPPQQAGLLGVRVERRRSGVWSESQNLLGVSGSLLAPLVKGLPGIWPPSWMQWINHDKS